MSLIPRNLWHRHELRVLDVLRDALSELATRKDLPGCEVALNRELLHVVRRVNRIHLKNGRGLPNPILFDVTNQPVNNPESRQMQSEAKRPDFLWGMVDTRGDKDLFFAVECKRLGAPPSLSWDLNKNYVLRGVARFSRLPHAYGQECRSGAMIGYVQSMNHEDIYAEVNRGLAREKIAKIVYDGSWTVHGVTNLRQSFRRDFPISPLKLVHLRVDLRT